MGLFKIWKDHVTQYSNPGSGNTCRKYKITEYAVNKMPPWLDEALGVIFIF